MLNKEKCQTCYKLGYSCCKTQPVFTTEELAKAYYESDVFNNLGKLQLVPVGNGIMVIKEEWVDKETNSFTLGNRDCLFLDSETGLCKIYDYRPSICKNFGEIKELPCPFQDIEVNDMKELTQEELEKRIENANSITKQNITNQVKINDILHIESNLKIIDSSPKTFQKELQNLHINRILYLIVYYLQTLPLDYLNINVNYKYHLVFLKNGKKNKFSSIRETIFDSKESLVKPICKTHNSLNRYILFRDRDVIELMIEQLNKIISSVNIDITKEFDSLKSLPTHKELENAINVYYRLSLINEILTNKKTPKAITSRLNKLNASELVKISYISLITAYKGVNMQTYLNDSFMDLINKFNKLPDEITSIVKKIDKYNQSIVKLLVKKK